MTDDLEYFDDAPQPYHAGWAIENVSTLEWAMGKKAKLEANLEDLEHAAQQARDRVSQRFNQLATKIHAAMSFFDSHIEKYANANREMLLGAGKAKSRQFLHGVIGWRKRGGRLVVVDAEALKTWLVEHGDETLYRVKIEPEMKNLQDQFSKTGVIPPGCEYVADQEKFYVEAVDPERMLP